MSLSVKSSSVIPSLQTAKKIRDQKGLTIDPNIVPVDKEGLSFDKAKDTPAYPSQGCKMYLWTIEKLGLQSYAYDYWADKIFRNEEALQQYMNTHSGEFLISIFSRDLARRPVSFEAKIRPWIKDNEQEEFEEIRALWKNSLRHLKRRT